jgi:hypothetical protein
MERLVLMAPVIVDQSKPGVPFGATIMVRLRPDIFIPVTEDADGVFYQAESGYRTIRGNALVPGGLYVSKFRPQKVWVYVGDAQMGSKFGMQKDNLPLPARVLHHFRTGKAERKK